MFRERKRNDLRGEEKRGEEKRREERTPLPPKGGTDFELFWSEYPRKVGKKAARKAWDLAKDLPPPEEVLAAVRRSRASADWIKDGGKFIPHPATWLNQGRWMDEGIDPAQAKAGDWKTKFDQEYGEKQ